MQDASIREFIDGLELEDPLPIRPTRGAPGRGVADNPGRPLFKLLEVDGEILGVAMPGQRDPADAAPGLRGLAGEIVHGAPGRRGRGRLVPELAAEVVST